MRLGADVLVFSRSRGNEVTRLIMKKVQHGKGRCGHHGLIGL
uniref:Uncharacterized protein n=1 Tax=Arundo donax TaxID=35708 RepID=A0A0A9D0C3_ARUDO